jgi:hypothetical protein
MGSCVSIRVPIPSSRLPRLYTPPGPEAGLEADSVPYVHGTAAYVLCEVVAVEMAEGHRLTRCRILGALVHPDYWKENKLFCPRRGAPPYLTFFGSQVRPVHPRE